MGFAPAQPILRAVPVQELQNARTESEVFEICRQLNDLGMIEWRPLQGENKVVTAMARITPRGNEAVENLRRSQAASSSVGNITINVEKSVVSMRDIGSTTMSMDRPKGNSVVAEMATSAVKAVFGWFSKKN